MLRPILPRKPSHIMGILNLTPDSFSDGGLHTADELPVFISQMIEANPSIIDIGGQSTAPGREEISAQEELGRILPAIQCIRQQFTKGTGPAISIDTYRASVAKEALANGADMINDVSGGMLDPEVLRTVAQAGSTICLMHMRGDPRNMSSLTSYPHGLIPTVAAELL